MLIPLAEYAKKHGRSIFSVRQKAQRGGVVSAHKIGRDWFIKDDEPYLDERRNDMEKSRSYLFGELLAIWEWAEQMSMPREGVTSLKTLDLKPKLIHHPAETYAVIERDVGPRVRANTPPEKFEQIQDWIGEILEQLDDIDGFTNEELDSAYLMGFYSRWRKIRPDAKKSI